MQTWYIYFDDLGKIYSVTNEKKTEGTYLETSEEKVKDFISGKKKFDNFTVKFTNDKEYYVNNKQSSYRLKYCNLEKLDTLHIDQIDFDQYSLEVFEFFESNYNFLKNTCVINSKEEIDFLKEKNVLFKKLKKNDENN